VISAARADPSNWQLSFCKLLHAPRATARKDGKIFDLSGKY